MRHGVRGATVRQLAAEQRAALRYCCAFSTAGNYTENYTAYTMILQMIGIFSQDSKFCVCVLVTGLNTNINIILSSGQRLNQFEKHRLPADSRNPVDTELQTAK